MEAAIGADEQEMIAVRRETDRQNIATRIFVVANVEFALTGIRVDDCDAAVSKECGEILLAGCKHGRLNSERRNDGAEATW